MATAYPAAIDSFVAKQDNVDDVEAVNINDLQEAIEALETKVGVTTSAVTASLDYKVNNFLVTGRQLYLYENTAPTGWSIIAVTDKVLAVKGGSNAYNANGGTTAGTWTQPTHTHADTLAAPAHTHADTLTAPAHTHTGPSHTHAQNSSGSDRSIGSAYIGASNTSDSVMTAAVSGGGSPRMNSGVVAGGTGNTGAASATALTGSVGAQSATALTGAITTASMDATWRPIACLGIMVLKA